MSTCPCFLIGAVVENPPGSDGSEQLANDCHSCAVYSQKEGSLSFSERRLELKGIRLSRYALHALCVNLKQK